MNNQNDKKPCPRLELRWENTDGQWKEKHCHYGLVLPLGEYDIRNEVGKGEFFVSIGETSVRSPKPHCPIVDGKINTPFRDGSHAQWDSKALGGLPVVAVCGDAWHLIEPSEAITDDQSSDA